MHAPFGFRTSGVEREIVPAFGEVPAPVSFRPKGICGWLGHSGYGTPALP